MNFPNVNHIDLKLKKRDFQSMLEHVLEVYERVNDSFQNRASSETLADYIIYDFVKTKITTSLVYSWQHKSQEKFYKYKLNVSVALAMLENLETNPKDNYFLSQFHIKLFNGTQRYISPSRLEEKTFHLEDG